GGGRENVVDGQTGILVSDTTPEAWATALTQGTATIFEASLLRANAGRVLRMDHLEQMQKRIANTKEAAVGTRWENEINGCASPPTSSPTPCLPRGRLCWPTVSDSRAA